MSTIYNFAAGPAVLPQSVLQIAQKELLNWQNTGVSIMEIGHRTNEFQELLYNLELKLRNVLTIPANYKVLFLPSGGQGHFSFIPLNLTGKNEQVDYLVSGIWSKRAALFAKRYAKVNLAADIQINTIATPDTWQLNPNAAYVYYCPNETIEGLQFAAKPEVGKVPLVADMTSSILMEEIKISDYGLIFAAAQKNLGIAGVTLLIIREDLLDQAKDNVPEIFNYKAQAAAGSLLNTIPVVAIYMMDLMLDWFIHEFGSITNALSVAQQKAELFYQCIDNSHGFYSNNIKNDYRSLINIPFQLANNDLLELFLTQAKAEGLVYLKGHKLVGGARASFYNALPKEGVAALIEYMRHFAARNS